MTPTTPPLEDSQEAGCPDATCSPPMGETGEDYYCKRDDFTRYIAEEVNPAREKAGLKTLDDRTAEICYRILNDFAKKAGLRPHTENAEPCHGANNP